MATPPANAAAPRASSVLSHAQTATTQGAKPGPAGAPTSVSTSGWVALRRVLFTAAVLADSKTLADALNKLQENILGVLGVVTTNQMVPGNILSAVALTQSAPIYLAHGLGRPWQGYFIVRTYAGSPVNIIVETTYPAGLTADKILPLIPLNTGTCDIYVF